MMELPVLKYVKKNTQKYDSQIKPHNFSEAVVLNNVN